jgi:hypothetical protein
LGGGSVVAVFSAERAEQYLIARKASDTVSKGIVSSPKGYGELPLRALRDGRHVPPLDGPSRGPIGRGRKEHGTLGIDECTAAVDGDFLNTGLFQELSGVSCRGVAVMQDNKQDGERCDDRKANAKRAEVDCGSS